MEVQWIDTFVFIIVSVIDLDYNGVWKEILPCDHSEERCAPVWKAAHAYSDTRVHSSLCYCTSTCVRSYRLSNAR